MTRTYIPLITGEMYHICNRGTEKRGIFLDKWDYLRFYNCLSLFNIDEPVLNYRLAQSENRSTDKPLVHIHAYSLLPNHYHLLLIQTAENGISEFIKRLAGGYSTYFNERHQRSGVLFQGRFKRVHIKTDEQRQYAFVYVNENHTVHTLQAPKEIYQSSSLHYRGITQSKALRYAPKVAYRARDAALLAKDVYKRRKEMKLDLTLE